MQLSVIGARSGMPAPGQPSSGYVVQTEQCSLLFDCGPGVAGELAKVVAPKDLDAVFISHLHLDHCYDALPIGKSILAPYVPYPREGTRMELLGEPPRIPLYTPAGGRDAFCTLQTIFPVVSSPPLDRAFELAFELREYPPLERVTIGDCEITAMPAKHAVPAYGFRVSSPAGTLAYTGDTGWTDTLPELADGADLLLCEASLRVADNGPHGHLSAAEAGRLASMTGVGTLVLTHFATTDADWLKALREDAAAHFGGPVLLAAPGRRFRCETQEIREEPS